MHKRWLIGGCVAMILLVAGSVVLSQGAQWGPDQPKPKEWGPEGEVTLIPNKECVVASELMGTWVRDVELSKRLGRDGGADSGEITFRASSDAEALILKDLKSALDKLKADPDKGPRLLRALQAVYLAGELELRQGENSKAVPFALVTLQGNPHIVIREKEDDFESFNVMLARHKEGDGDLLFIGGDFNNQSFTAYKRKDKGPENQPEGK